MSKENEILNSYIKCVNRIDDLLEYQYKCFTTEELRDSIISIIEVLTNELSDK